MFQRNRKPENGFTVIISHTMLYANEPRISESSPGPYPTAACHEFYVG